MPALAADAAAVSATSAHEAPATEASAPKASWYGWQTLLSDVGSALLIAFSLRVNSGDGGTGAVAVAGLGVGGYVFGGPLIHWAHDRDLAAYADFSMRLGFPLLLGQLAAIGANQSDIGGSCTSFCGSEGSNFGQGLLVGIATAVLVDAVGLSWEFVPNNKDAQTSRLRWTPVAGAAREGAIGGVGGTF